MTVPNDNARPPPQFFLSELTEGERKTRWSPFDSTGVPETADWRPSDGTEPVRNQGNGQTCTAHALAALYEAVHYRRTNKRVSISAPYIHACLAGLDWDSGLDLAGFVRKVLKGQLVPPYDASNRIEPHQCAAPVAGFALLNLERVKGGEAQAKRVLARSSPIVAGMRIADNFRNLLQFEYRPDGGPCGDHTVCLVGYDRNGWIVKNSYGRAWGKDGYFHIKFGQADILGPLAAFYVPSD